MDPVLKGIVGKVPRDSERVTRLWVYGSFGALSFVCVVVAVLTAMDIAPWHKRYVTDWFLGALLLGVGPLAVFNGRDFRRIADMDERFPEFLRDIAESARAGMTLPRAMVSASKSHYGALTHEIKRMAAQVEWGVDFTEAMARFAGRTKSQLIKRTVSLVIEARRSGGNVVDVLTAASNDAREIKQIVEDRSNQMKAYGTVIYVTFFVFLAVVMILQTQFIPAFALAVQGAEGQQVGGLNFNAVDQEGFTQLFFHAAIIQGIGSGLVGGVLTRGNPVAGLKGIMAMLLIAWFAFRVV